MTNINQAKEQPTTDTPLLMFQCVLSSGDVERWCSHGVILNNSYYEARVLRHNLFDLQLSSDDAMDGLSKLTITLANADSALSELNTSIGFKGAQLTVYFGFANLATQQVTTESAVLFRGVAGDPDEITEEAMTLSFINKLSLQRMPLPETRIQRTCPWMFPATTAQRTEALNGGSLGAFSRFFKCGYSADILGGIGNLDPTGKPYTTCNKSRSQCQQRGLFNIDAKMNTTARFGGLEFVPSTVNVRTYGDKSSHVSALISNTAKYNDSVPLVYGTGWLRAPIVFARNDGNLTHIEVLLGAGSLTSILKVVVNDIEIPAAVTVHDMTTTGWYSLFASGAVSGSFNNDFLDNSGNPAGDPYGSMAGMSVVVPNRISSGSSLPNVEVLMQGLKVDTFAQDGSFAQNMFSNNPAWVILDILRRCGWSLGELDMSAFYSAAQFCGELIPAVDTNGNAITVQRFQTNLVLSKRQSAAAVVRGIRVSSSLMLRYAATGLLQVVPETTLSRQQSAAPDGTNSTQPLGTGWPAYEFSDGSAQYSGIVRLANGASSVRLTSRSIAESSNRLSVEFQDESNEYQQDSLSIVDSGDSALIGYEIASQSAALGVPNYNQATRVLLRQLDKTLKGNLFVEFQTSFRAFKVRPGDIITVTYLKEGFQRVPFRVVKLSPSINYQLVTVTAQIHNDDWYSDDVSVLERAGRQPLAQIQAPRALVGLAGHTSQGLLDYFDFQVSEQVQALDDGTATDLLTVGFSQPTKPAPNAPSLPLVSLSPLIVATGGTLPGVSTYYYSVSAVDGSGAEGALSFTIKADVTATTNTNSVTLNDLSFPASAVSFNVYRGKTPQLMYRIASSQPIATSYVDQGAPIQPVGPPDPNFDHATFYYRYEVAGPLPVSGSGVKLLQCSDMAATPSAYASMLVRITEGTGRGQERSIVGNDASSLTLSFDWTTPPDSSSTFVICESAWRFAAISNVSPIQFSVPYRAKSVVQITGRAANAQNQEGVADLCPITRVPLGQSTPDFGVPGIPTYSLQAPGSGELTLSQIGFTADTNIASISSGTLSLYYWNELAPVTGVLSAAISAATTTLSLVAGNTINAGSFLQAGQEIIYVLQQNADGSYSVLRGQLGSTAQALTSGENVTLLVEGKMVVPFAQNFFQSRAAVNLIHTFQLPDVRVVAAQFFVTNGFGSSQTQTACLTNNGFNGIRTLSGGQYTLQSNGYLATQKNATPPLTIPMSHAIRDVRLSLGQASVGYDTGINLWQNGTALCTLTITAGTMSSNLLDGSALPVLMKDAVVTADITSTLVQGTVSQPVPAKDLTITIRL